MAQPANQDWHWPSNDIERLFESAVKDAAARPVLEREILKAELSIIVEGDTPPSLPEGRVTLEAGTNVGLRMMHDGDGTTALPAFTSVALLQRAVPRETPRYATMPGRDLFTMTRGTRILVNPLGPYGKQFFPEEIDRLLAGVFSDESQQVDVPAGTQVLLGQLADKPADLIKAVSDALASEPTVASAYIAAMAVPGPDPSPHPIIGVECSADYAGVRARLAPVLSQWAGSTGRVVDLFDMSVDSPITQHLRSSQKFYPASWLSRVLDR